jgi:hypothetical protein
MVGSTYAHIDLRVDRDSFDRYFRMASFGRFREGTRFGMNGSVHVWTATPRLPTGDCPELAEPGKNSNAVSVSAL